MNTSDFIASLDMEPLTGNEDDDTLAMYALSIYEAAGMKDVDIEDGTVETWLRAERAAARKK